MNEKEFAFSVKSKERMKGVHPQLIMVATEALKVSPIDFGIPPDGGVRTAKQQRKLYLKELSKCDGSVNKSNHQIDKSKSDFGLALDVYAYVNGGASWKKEHLAIIAGVMLSTAEKLKAEGKISISIKWGGTFGSDDFMGWDYPHFEVVL